MPKAPLFFVFCGVRRRHVGLMAFFSVFHSGRNSNNLALAVSNQWRWRELCVVAYYYCAVVREEVGRKWTRLLLLHHFLAENWEQSHFVASTTRAQDKTIHVTFSRIIIEEIIRVGQPPCARSFDQELPKAVGVISVSIRRSLRSFK